MRKIEVGDTVVYSREFLRRAWRDSEGDSTRGTVTRVIYEPLFGSGCRLLEVEWNNGESSYIKESNLIPRDQRHLEAF